MVILHIKQSLNKVKQYSEACERNKDPILEQLKAYLPTDETWHVLEIGSGTGQHAVYFAEALPHCHWQPADRVLNHDSIKAYVQEKYLENLRLPIELDVERDRGGDAIYDAVFTANTCHIMSWQQVCLMFDIVSERASEQGFFFIYGPFKVAGEFTSPSNAEFDSYLKSIAPYQGIRDLEAIAELGQTHGFELVACHEMPANNQFLVFKRA